MKFSAWATVLCVASLGRAQYFSEGWKPGQPAATPVQIKTDSEFESAGESGGEAERTEPHFQYRREPEKPARLDILSLFDAKTYLESDISKNFFARFGFNITEKLAAAEAMPWDPRVPLITDDNYEDMIVNEQLSEEEEKDRVWAIVITAASGRTDGLSTFVDEAFDDSFNQTLIANDLPNIKWARLDYFNVTYLTTKWSVWHAPYIVILKDRGQTLRFYSVQSLRLRNGAFREFLLADGWLTSHPWSSAYAPGGEREYLIDFFAVWMTKIYNFIIRVPKFLLLIASGTVASFLLGFMHKGSSTPVAKPKPTAQATTAPVPVPTPETPSKSSGTSTSGSKPSKRKGKK